MSPAGPNRQLPLYARTLIGLGVGVLGGVLLRALLEPASAQSVAERFVRPIGTLWMRLILMTVVPMVFAALATGVAALGDLTRLGRIGLRTLGFTVVISTAAVLIGLTLVNVVQPGRGLPPATAARLQEAFKSKSDLAMANARAAKSLTEVLIDVVPQNPIEEAATAFNSPRGGMLAVMFFSLIFGVALTRIAPELARPVTSLLEGVYAALMTIVGWVMKLAPLGVGALMLSATATLGLEFLAPLLKFVAVAIGGLALHQFGVYALVLKLCTGISPLRFFRKIRSIMATAFATSSSNATLPTSLAITQSELGVPREIATFVLTLGSTANQNGTALFEGVVVLFLAQFFGVELSLAQQLQVLLMAVLAGIGTAGVPGGSLPMIVIVMQSVGVPAEGIGLVLGVDRLLDMCRTTVNVTGDVLVATYVAHKEGYPLEPLRTDG